NQFRARIFPIAAGGTKEVILSFSHELRGPEGYVLPLRGLPGIDKLSVVARVAESDGAKGIRYKVREMGVNGGVPTKDFHVPVAASASGSLVALRHGNHIVARVRPELDVAASRPSGLTILFDTSASRAPGFAKQVQ